MPTLPPVPAAVPPPEDDMDWSLFMHDIPDDEEAVATPAFDSSNDEPSPPDHLLSTPRLKTGLLQVDRKTVTTEATQKRKLAIASDETADLVPATWAFE